MINLTLTCIQLLIVESIANFEFRHFFCGKKYLSNLFLCHTWWSYSQICLSQCVSFAFFASFAFTIFLCTIFAHFHNSIYIETYVSIFCVLCENSGQGNWCHVRDYINVLECSKHWMRRGYDEYISISECQQGMKILTIISLNNMMRQKHHKRCSKTISIKRDARSASTKKDEKVSTLVTLVFGGGEIIGITREIVFVPPMFCLKHK